jgi:hypothetical protein
MWVWQGPIRHLPYKFLKIKIEKRETTNNEKIGAVLAVCERSPVRSIARKGLAELLFGSDL